LVDSNLHNDLTGKIAGSFSVTPNGFQTYENEILLFLKNA
jgi:hypothetical protein